MSRKPFQLDADGIILFFAFILANLRPTMFVYLYPDTSKLLGPAWIEIALWFLIAFVLICKLVRNNQIADYLLIVRGNQLVALFILLALVSAFWSIDSVVTLFRALELFFATLIAVYIGMRYLPEQLIELLFWLGALLLILSIATVFAAPKTGTMYWPPFNGAWRGIYWHRNHFSSVTALLSVVFLCRVIVAIEKRNATGILDGFFYVLSLVVLYFTRSATGYILFISLNSLVVCIWLWLRIYPRLRKWHYYVIFGGLGVGLVLMLLNLDVVLGLFNRNSTLTGRVQLWNYLLADVVPQRLWWGHGFGAVWTQDSFREEVRLSVGWASQPLIADNGFLDILLHLGIVGVLILLGILAIAILRAFRYAVSRKTVADFFPLLLMIYALIANISFSLLAETEVFIWLLIVSILVMTMPSSGLIWKKSIRPGMDQKSRGVESST